MLPNRLNLFIADVVSDITGEQILWNIVGRTYRSAFRKFIKEANRSMRMYSYYFYEASAEEVANFITDNDCIKAGVYE